MPSNINDGVILSDENGRSLGNIQEFRVGDQILLSCQEGFRIEGDPLANCQIDGLFSSDLSETQCVGELLRNNADGCCLYYKAFSKYQRNSKQFKFKIVNFVFSLFKHF